MTNQLRPLSSLTLVIMLLAAGPAAAGSFITVKSLACENTGQASASVSASVKNGTMTIKVKAKGLTPGDGLACGYTCAQPVGGAQDICGTVGTNGKGSGTGNFTVPVCFGFMPYFLTATTGKCVAAIHP